MSKDDQQKRRAVIFVSGGSVQWVAGEVAAIVVDADTEGEGDYGGGNYNIWEEGHVPISDIAPEIQAAIEEYDNVPITITDLPGDQ